MPQSRIPMSDITPDLLRRLFHCDPETGFLTWKPRGEQIEWDNRFAGKRAGNLCRGYIYVSVYGRPVRAHRVVWAIHFNEMPTGEIDHIDCDGSNNRISNLRLADRFANNQNTRKKKHNKSGFKGVMLHKQSNLWRAEIRSNGIYRCLGYFKTPEEAHRAYSDAAIVLNGEFARTA